MKQAQALFCFGDGVVENKYKVKKQLVSVEQANGGGGEVLPAAVPEERLALLVGRVSNFTGL